MLTRKQILRFGLIALLAVTTAGMLACGKGGAMKNMILATTTSTQDSGLLDELVPMFEKKTGYFVKTIAVGSGQAMSMGKKGEADVLLVHSPDAEKKFMEEKHGLTRRLVMHNDFVIIGPAEDPAKIKGEKKATAALKKIAESKSLFLSRGDKSGTHAAELKLWKQAGVAPVKGDAWYQETGIGMGQTIGIAAEKKGYTLTDRATYLAFKDKVKLVILLEGDAPLLNIYHVIDVDPSKNKKINHAAGKAFADFMVSKEAQEAIKVFGVKKYGSPLFFADAGKKVEDVLK